MSHAAMRPSRGDVANVGSNVHYPNSDLREFRSAGDSTEVSQSAAARAILLSGISPHTRRRGVSHTPQLDVLQGPDCTHAHRTPDSTVAHTNLRTEIRPSCIVFVAAAREFGQRGHTYLGGGTQLQEVLPRPPRAIERGVSERVRERGCCWCTPPRRSAPQAVAADEEAQAKAHKAD
eukprot:3591391-Prymnesium_polylepis.1